jgi:predicted PurR-regulated permease PerM
MWAAIAITFLVILGLFLLGLYLIIRKASKSVEKVPEQVVKEVFTIIKDKIKKVDETRVSDSGQGNSQG